jgi:hypothetical protein
MCLLRVFLPSEGKTEKGQKMKLTDKTVLIHYTYKESPGDNHIDQYRDAESAKKSLLNEMSEGRLGELIKSHQTEIELEDDILTIVWDGRTK